MNNTQKYKLDTAGIAAMAVFVPIYIFVRKGIFASVAPQDNLVETVVIICLMGMYSAIFGYVSAGIGGFLAVVCACSLCADTSMFGEAFAMASFGVVLGFFADKLKVRDGAFGKKEMLLFMLLNFTVCITALIYVRPFLDFMLYGKDLFVLVRVGIIETLICAVPMGIITTFLIFSISKLIRYVKT